MNSEEKLTQKGEKWKMSEGNGAPIGRWREGFVGVLSLINGANGYQRDNNCEIHFGSQKFILNFRVLCFVFRVEGVRSFYSISSFSHFSCLCATMALSCA